MNTASMNLLAGLLLLALAAIGASVNILLRGSLFKRLKPESRPRRWVLVALLLLFAVFAIWFPVWVTWPNSLVAKALTLTFGIVFGVIGMTLRWFTGAVDLFVVKRGWRLR
jgi:drug/metabolite transporter (DMT)-like permease